MYSVSLSIDVPDLAAGADFFDKAFGFGKEKEVGNMVILDANGLKIYLLQREDGSSASKHTDATRHYDRHWTPIHLDILVDDVDEALARAISAGAVQEGDKESGDWGAIAYCADPWGNGFCLIQEG